MSPLGSLALVQGAITLCWVIYDLVLPRLLAEAGLDSTWIRSLLVMENLLLLGIEPAMGVLSDRWRHLLARRWSLIGGAALVAATLFGALPWLAIAGMGGPFVGLVLVWSVAMAVFRSPVLSLLAQMGGQIPLPIAASLLTLSSGVWGALRPIAQDFLLSLGAVPAFAAGALALGGAVLYLRSAAGSIPDAYQGRSPIPWKRVCGLAGAGAAMGTAIRLLLGIAVPEAIARVVPPPWVSWSLTGVLLWQTAWAILGGWGMARWGLGQTLRPAAVTVAILCLVLLFQPAGAVVAVPLLAAGLGVVTHGMIPLALVTLPPRWGGLGIGTYFGAFGGAIALWAVAVPSGSLVYGLAAPALGGVAALLVYLLP